MVLEVLEGVHQLHQEYEDLGPSNAKSQLTPAVADIHAAIQRVLTI